MDEILKMQVMVGRAQLQYHDHQMLLKLQLVDTILVLLKAMESSNVLELTGLDNLLLQID